MTYLPGNSEKKHSEGVPQKITVPPFLLNGAVVPQIAIKALDRTPRGHSPFRGHAAPDMKT